MWNPWSSNTENTWWNLKGQAFTKTSRQGSKYIFPANDHSRPQSLRSFWPAAGNNRILPIWFHCAVCIYGACLKWLLPELSIPAAGQKDRRLWGWEWRTTCSTVNLCSGFKSRTSGKYFRLSEIASLMSSETRSSIFNNYYAPHQSAGKLTCAKALATCGCIHVVEWSVHQNAACRLVKFHSDIPMSRYFLHYSPRSMFKIDTIVTDYDTLWSVRKKEFYLGANIWNGLLSYHFDISSLSREIKMKVSLLRRTKQEGFVCPIKRQHWYSRLEMVW